MSLLQERLNNLLGRSIDRKETNRTLFQDKIDWAALIEQKKKAKQAQSRPPLECTAVDTDDGDFSESTLVEASLVSNRNALRMDVGVQTIFLIEVDTAVAASNMSFKEKTKKQGKVHFDPKTVFLDAAANGDVNAVNTCLNILTDDLNTVRTGTGMTALHLLAGCNCPEGIQIISNLCDVNGREEIAQWAPLHIAVMADASEAIQCLLRVGADLEATDKFGQTPLCLAKNQTGIRATLQAALKQKYSSNHVMVIYDHKPQEDGELPLKRTQKFNILDRQNTMKGWWMAEDPQTGQKGLIPSTHVQ